MNEYDDREELVEETEESGRSSRGRDLRFIIVTTLYLLIVAASIAAWCLNFEPWELRQQLISATPWFLEITFAVIVVAAFLSAPAVRAAARGITRREWGLALAAGALGTSMAAFAAPQIHRIYYDENIYLNIGQTIAAEKKAAMCSEGYNRFGEYTCAQLEHNKQPYGFPHLLSLLYRVTGPSEKAAFLFNNAIFGLSVVVTFFLGFLLFESAAAGLWAALIYALVPENIVWAGTTAIEPSAAFITGVTVTAAVLFVKERTTPLLLLLAGLLAYGIQFRTESFLVAPIAGLFLLLLDRRVFKEKRLYLFAVVSLALAAHHIVHLYAVRNESWGSSGARMAFEYFSTNFKTNTLYYLRNERFPLLFTAAALGGLCLFSRLKERLALVSWFLIYWGIFLFFYAGSYEYGQDVRYSLMSYQPLALLAAAGLTGLEKTFGAGGRRAAFRTLVVTLLVLSFSSFLPYVRTEGEEANQARYDHRYAREMADLLPENSIILTHNPNMFLIWGKNAAQASMASGNAPRMDFFTQRFKDGVYFHYNFWCNVDDPVQQGFCRNILDQYDSEAIAEYEGGGYDFALYRIRKKQVE